MLNAVKRRMGGVMVCAWFAFLILRLRSALDLEVFEVIVFIICRWRGFVFPFGILFSGLLTSFVELFQFLCFFRGTLCRIIPAHLVVNVRSAVVGSAVFVPN